MGKQEVFAKILDELSRLEAAEGAAIVGGDGMLIASKMDKKFAQDKIAALISHAVNTSKKVLVEAGLGQPDTVTLEGKEGKIVLMHSEKGSFFIFIIGKKELNLGLARMVLDESIEDFDESIK